MKNLISLILISLLLTGCIKDENLSGPYTIKGRVLNNCEDQQPVANQLLYFLVDVDSDEEDRVAYTDANGNFSYSFDGPPNNNSTIGGSIRIQDDKPILCGIPSSSLTADKEIDAGTLYVNTTQEADVTFRIEGTGYTDKDTVVIARVFHSDLRIVSDFKVPGPFEPAVEITREWLKYASSEDDNMTSYSTMTQPFVKRLNGTFGVYCRWQVNKGNQLGDVQKDFILMDVCENETTFNIDLSEAE